MEEPIFLCPIGVNTYFFLFCLTLHSVSDEDEVEDIHIAIASNIGI